MLSVKKKNWHRIMSMLMALAMIFNFWICDYAVTEVQAASLSTSQEGIDLLKRWEGCRLTAYKPYSTEAYYTIGYGHYGSDVYAGMTITQAQAEEMLKNDLKKYEGFVNNFLNKYGVNVTQNQFDALASFTYNLGDVWGRTFDLKTILINGANNYPSEDIVAAFTEWCIAGGQVSQGLINRRKDEAALFLKDRGYIPPERDLYVTSPYMTGSDVIWVQERLCELGYTVDIDGIYGPDTEKKIIQFQSNNGLAADGICGKNTKNKLREKHIHNYTEYVYCWKDHPHYKCYRCSCGEIKENRNEPTYVDTCAECNKQNNNPYPEPTRNLSLQSPYCTGDDVKWVQWCLVQLGYSLDIDGIYGKDTHTQVANFQRDNDLTVDGICGANTRAKLKEKIEPHNHSYSVSARTEPTCTQNGSVTYKCSCGASYSETLNALGHSYTTKTVVATCTAQGYTLHTCSRCGNSYKDTYTNALGHDYKLTSQKAATCTTDGEKIYTCSRCGGTKTETVKATGHSYTTKTVAATCTEQGYTLHTCSRCGNSYKDAYTNALGHSYATKVVAPTYTEQGYTLHTCSRCGNNYKDSYTNKLQYVISYNMNGGSGSIANQLKNHGQDITLSSTKPTRTGYDFVGWNTNASATTAQYSAGDKYTANSGATLYAIWKIQAPSAKPVIANLNETYNVGQDLTITWNKIDRASSYWVNIWRNPGGESTKIVNTSITANSYTLSKLTPGKYGIIIDAKNESGYTTSELYNFYVPFTIKYDMNGGTGTISPTYKKLDIECTLSSTVPTKTDYKFIGWNTDKNATTAQYQAGSKYKANGDVTLYAIWEKINYNAAPAAKGNFNGNTYEYYTQTLNWNQAYRFCEKKGGHLVTVTSKEENDFIVELTKSRSGALWSGGKTSDHKTWYWITGEPFNYQNWETGEPNNLNNTQDTLQIYVSGKWDDDDSALSIVREFVCEYDNNIDAAKYTPAYTEQYNDHEYYFFADSVDWQTARKICEAKGGYLAIPNNAEENAFIISGMKKTSKEESWIGITDIAQEGVWKDVKGNSLMYTNWASGQPDNSQNIEDYGHLYSSGQWNDVREYGSMYRSIGFVCEFDTLCTASGHDYKLTSTKAATCTANGEKIYTCSRCGHTKTETIKATGHKYTEKVVAPTTAAQGYTLHTCSVCGHSYKDNYTDKLLEQLVNNSTLSAETIKLGETVTVSAKASGGAGSYQYNVLYKQKSQSKWTTVQAYKANATVSIKPANATTYDICVKVKDSNGTEVKKYFTVKVTNALQNNSIISKTEINLGDTITVNGQATGGTGSYTYAVYYKKTSDSKWSTAQAYKNNATVSIKPANATTYDICVKVKDSDGTEVKKYVTVKVTNALQNNSTISKTEINLGDTVTVNGKATGGTGNYTYAVYYKKTSDSKWSTAQAYKNNATVAIKPINATTYDICVKIKDRDGTEVKKYFNVKVTDPMKNVSIISSTSVTLGDTITVTGKASGGTNFYVYAVYCQESQNTKWTVVQDYSSNSIVMIKPDKATKYNICVKVKDSDGTIEKKYFDVTVNPKLSELINTSKLSETSIKLGDTIQVICSAQGGTGFYQYAIYYKKTNDTKWTTKQSYSPNSIIDIKPSESSVYDVCIKVKDNLNNENKKYFTLTVK